VKTAMMSERIEVMILGTTAAAASLVRKNLFSSVELLSYSLKKNKFREFASC
jgi:hypothetical protein